MKLLKSILKVGIKVYGILALVYMAIIGTTETVKAGYYNPDTPIVDTVMKLYTDTVNFWKKLFKELKES